MKISEELAAGIAAGGVKALEEFAGLIIQETLRALPRATRRLSEEAFVLQTKARDFYEKNPELASERGLVQKLVEKEEARNPGLSIDELLERVRPKALAKVGEKGRLKEIKPQRPTNEALTRRLK